MVKMVKSAKINMSGIKGVAEAVGRTMARHPIYTGFLGGTALGVPGAVKEYKKEFTPKKSPKKRDYEPEDVYQKRVERSHKAQKGFFDRSRSRRVVNKLYEKAFPGAMAGMYASLLGVGRFSGGGYRFKGFGTSGAKSAYKANKAGKAFDNTLRSVKTKEQAKQQFWDAARKFHPDKGGSADDFDAVKNTWDTFKGSKAFDKLAFLLTNGVEGSYKEAFIDELEKISGCKSHGKVKPKKAKKII